MIEQVANSFALRSWLLQYNGSGAYLHSLDNNNSNNETFAGVEAFAERSTRTGLKLSRRSIRESYGGGAKVALV